MNMMPGGYDYGGYPGGHMGGPRNTDLQDMFRLRMAQQLAQQAQSGPVYSPGQGIVKLLAGALAGQQMGSTLEGIDARKQAAADELAGAFRPIPSEGVAGPRVGTGTAPTTMDIARSLAGSSDPENAKLGIGLYTQGLNRQQENDDWQHRFTLQDQAAERRQRESLDAQRQMHSESNAAAEKRAQLMMGARQPQVVTTADGIYVLGPDGKLGNRLGNSPKTQAGLSPTAQKELFEADDVVNQATSAEDALSKALELNDKALSGAGAGARTWYARNAPEVLGGDPKLAAESTQFNQLVTEQALQSLKAIFGGNPTEGERAILLEMQAAPSMSQAERKALLSRAIQAVQSRKKFAGSRATQLREGTYFKDGGGPSVAPPSAMPGPAAGGWSIQPVP